MHIPISNKKKNYFNPSLKKMRERINKQTCSIYMCTLITEIFQLIILTFSNNICYPIRDKMMKKK